MWGAFLSEPLRIVGLGSRYLPNYLMRRMPIPVRLSPFLLPGCPGRIYAELARLSPGCPPDRGRLHTCYSPVRRSPAEEASFSSAAPRLACVKPAASVHPEPGSNSPLLLSLFSFFLLSLRSQRLSERSKLRAFSLYLTAGIRSFTLAGKFCFTFTPLFSALKSPQSGEI